MFRSRTPAAITAEDYGCPHWGICWELSWVRGGDALRLFTWWHASLSWQSRYDTRIGRRFKKVYVYLLEFKMKLFHLLLCVAFLVVVMDSAHAKNWRRAKGNLYMTRYEDTDGNTLNDIDAGNRVIRINADLRKSSNTKGVKTKCKDTKRLKQRSCRSVYYYNISGQGDCLYVTQTTMHNFTSSSRNIYAYAQAVVQCPTGWAAYFAAEGEVRRS